MKKILTSLGIMLVASSAVAATYTVKGGDTMKNIANANGMTYDALRDLNPQISNPNLIYPGQKLNLGAESEKAAAKQAVVEKKEEAKQVVIEKKEEVKAEVKKAPRQTAQTKCAACDNVINGNPMYRPDAGRFYSITTFGTNTNAKDWALNERFGFGITDALSVFLDTTASTHRFDRDSFNWDNLAFGLSARLLDINNWKADAYGKMAVNSGWDGWWHGDNTFTWTAGTKIGYSTCGWTLNGLFEFDYTNTDAFNWDETPAGREYRVGAEGQYVFNADWNIVASVMYEMPEAMDNYFAGQIGVNYNFDTTKYLGLYVFQELHDGDLNKETGLALQFGIDF